MHAFRPIQVGTMQLDHRLVVTPHVGGGRLLESDELFERYCAYWLARLSGGVQWLGGEPVAGSERHPMFAERAGEYLDRVHAAGGFATVQLTLAAGADDAEAMSECIETSLIAAAAGADAIELRSVRSRGLHELVGRIRSAIDRPITIGVRVGLGAGELHLDECRQVLAALTAQGAVDYFSLDVGGDVDAGSLIPPGSYDEDGRAQLCGSAKQATHLPVVYVGRVLDLATAELVLRSGDADLVGCTRAVIADPDVVARVRRGETSLVRPCVGVNDCADRRAADGDGFVCAANPHAGNEHIRRLAPVKRSWRVLVIGGGPAGTEFAALAKQRGHRVMLWERESVLGGQLAIAAKARMNSRFGEWIRWQEDRLRRLAVTVELRHEATLDDIEVVGPNVVVVATGSVPRTLDVPGVDQPFVHQAVDVMRGDVELGHHVLVVADDDSATPLAVADHLSGLGHRVTVTFPATAPPRELDSYTIQASLARLDRDGAHLVPLAQVVAIEPGRVHLAHIFSGRRWTLEGVDNVVLACGAVSDNELYVSLKRARPNVHVLGDAYQPRRMAGATRHAWQLASSLD